MSDLQCPARFVVIVRDSTTVELERVAVVYDGSGEELPGGVTFAERLAASLAVPHRPIPHGPAPHRPVPPPLVVDDVAGRSPAALEVLGDLADLHRGETVVLVVGGAPGSRLDVHIDADGMVVRAAGTGSAT